MSDKCSTSGCTSVLQRAEEKASKRCWYCACERCGKLIPEDIRETSTLCSPTCTGERPAVAVAKTASSASAASSSNVAETVRVTQKEEVMATQNQVRECEICEAELGESDEGHDICDNCRCAQCGAELDDKDAAFCNDCQKAMKKRKNEAKAKEVSFETPNTVKDMAKEVGVRTAANTLNRQGKRALVHLFTRHITNKAEKNKAVKILEQLLAGPLGDALMGIIIGYGLGEAPSLYAKIRSKEMSPNMQKNLQKLATETKVSGLTTLSTEVVNYIAEMLNGENLSALKAFLSSDAGEEEEAPKPRAKKVKVAETVPEPVAA